VLFLTLFPPAQPLYNDYRRVRRRTAEGKFALQHVDQFIEELLTQA
jgi:pre-mRNA-splicing factor 38A